MVTSWSSGTVSQVAPLTVPHQSLDGPCTTGMCRDVNANIASLNTHDNKVSLCRCYLWKSQNMWQRKTGVIILNLQTGKLRECDFFMVSLVSDTAGNKKQSPNSLVSQSHNLLCYVDLSFQSGSALYLDFGITSLLSPDMNLAFK